MEEALLQAIIGRFKLCVEADPRGSALANAVRRFARGESLLDRALTGRVLRGCAAVRSKTSGWHASVPRERRITHHIPDGLGRQIAAHMSLVERRSRTAVFAAKLEVTGPRLDG
jgi:two-component system response regulator DevR